MLFNITPDMTQNELINACHSFLGKPSIILIVAFASIMYWVSLYLVVGSNHINFQKVLFAWILFVFALVIALVFMFSSPNLIASIFN